MLSTLSNTPLDAHPAWSTPSITRTHSFLSMGPSCSQLWYSFSAGRLDIIAAYSDEGGIDDAREVANVSMSIPCISERGSGRDAGSSSTTFVVDLSMLVSRFNCEVAVDLPGSDEDDTFFAVVLTPSSSSFSSLALRFFFAAGLRGSA